MSCQCDNWLERQQQGLPGRCLRHHMMMTAIRYAWDHAPAEITERIYAAGDGFTPGQTGPEFDWDWSGIRDSTPEGVERMYEIVEEANATG